jgi:two-component system sensor histidine kinase UhpB
VGEVDIRQKRITEPVVLRVLTAGFGLVVTLLGLAGYIAVNGTRAIEDDAAQVGREQLAMARLLNDVQAGQHSMATVLHQLAPGAVAFDRKGLLAELEAADKALANVALSATSTPEAENWRALEVAVKKFSAGMRGAVGRTTPLTAKDLEPLFDLHDKVVHIEQQLLEASEKRMELTEQRIEAGSRDLAANSRILLGACLILALLCAVVTLVFARANIRKIEEQASELSRVSWHLLQDQESNARRFSHELHDELGQSLAAIKANLTTTVDSAERRADCIKLVDEAIANVRVMSQLLHPVILDDFGLDAGLRWLTDGFEQRTGIRTTYACSFAGRLDNEVETHLFRIAQEALTNVARHSGATETRVELHPREESLILSIEDNGCGMRKDERPKQPSIGLTGMRARAQEIRGVLEILTPKEGGLRIEVAVPLENWKGVDAEQEDARIAG